MASTDTWLPLFPLKSVLFPGGVLPLKVFETRYIDMVSECMKANAPFGVVLIKSGEEVGAPAEPEAVGCLAYIIDWEMPSMGMMMLRTQGGERFRILETRVLADQRMEARAAMIAPDSAVAVSDIHLSCARALKIVIDDMQARGKAEFGDQFELPFAQPIRLDHAGWVANRWCEILPIPLKARQALLELNDSDSRLNLVHRYLQQHQIL
jgi:uncharacterized protein